MQTAKKNMNTTTTITTSQHCFTLSRLDEMSFGTYTLMVGEQNNLALSCKVVAVYRSVSQQFLSRFILYSSYFQIIICYLFLGGFKINSVAEYQHVKNEIIVYCIVEYNELENIKMYVSCQVNIVSRNICLGYVCVHT